MSAFVVGTAHIAYLVRAAAQLARSGGFGWVKDGRLEMLDGYDQERLRLLGQTLLDANVKSVSVRYGEDLAPQKYDHRAEYGGQPVDLVQMFKAADCLEYQSDQYDGWNESEALCILVSLRRTAIRALPGYDKAAWEVK